jgi:hypothetical protein
MRYPRAVVAGLRRSTRELDPRRQRAYLETEPSDPSTRLEQPLGKPGFGLALVLWSFAGFSIVIISLDRIVAGWNENPPTLGFGWAILLSLALATPLGWLHRWRLTTPEAPRVNTRPLADAFRREMEVAFDSKARIDHVDVRATRAWGWFEQGNLRLLVLDCGGETRVFLSGPALEAHTRDHAPDDTVPLRWTVEALQWTRVIVSLLARGERIPLRSIELEPGTFDLRECEVRMADELPEALARAVGLLPTSRRDDARAST